MPRQFGNKPRITTRVRDYVIDKIIDRKTERKVRKHERLFRARFEPGSREIVKKMYRSTLAKQAPVKRQMV